MLNGFLLNAIEIKDSWDTLFWITDDLKVNTYGFMIALGLVAAFVTFYFLTKKFAISDRSFNFYSTTVIIAIILGFLSALLFQSVYNWIASGFKDFHLSGLTFLGGLIGGVAIFLIATAFIAPKDVRRDFWKIANLMAPCIPLAHGFGRIGCLFARCCYGLPSDLPIAVKYEHMRYAVLPTQLFEALFLFALFAVMMVLLFKFKRVDLLMIVYLFSYAVWRFIIEYFRSDNRGEFVPGLTPSQFQSIVMLLIAGALTLYIFYFDRIPFRGKDKVGRDFYLVAAKEFAETAEAIKAEAALRAKEAAESETEDETSESAENETSDDTAAMTETPPPGGEESGL